MGIIPFPIEERVEEFRKMRETIGSRTDVKDNKSSHLKKGNSEVGEQMVDVGGRNPTYADSEK